MNSAVLPTFLWVQGGMLRPSRRTMQPSFSSMIQSWLRGRAAFSADWVAGRRMQWSRWKRMRLRGRLRPLLLRPVPSQVDAEVFLYCGPPRFEALAQ